jgi:hypothetical protein
MNNTFDEVSPEKNRIIVNKNRINESLVQQNYQYQEQENEDFFEKIEKESQKSKILDEP